MDIEIRYLPTGGVNLVVARQPGVSFAEAAPKLKAFAAQLKLELGEDVYINGEPEMHLHAPDGSHVQIGQRDHAR